MSEITKAVALVASVALVAVVAYVQSDKYLHQTAVQDCKMVARHTEKLNQWIEITIPVDDEYQKCIKAKGYTK